MVASTASEGHRRIKRGLSSVIRGFVPLTMRKCAASWIGRQSWLPERHSRSVALIRDLAERDPEEYHRFLWTHHLGYAESYEPELRFGRCNLRPERQLLLRDVRSYLGDAHDVRSVLEVG